MVVNKKELHSFKDNIMVIIKELLKVVYRKLKNNWINNE